jgi:hypothetical protein
VPDGALEIHAGRPDLVTECLELSPTGVYYCGGARLGKALREACAGPELQVPVHEEEFQNPTFSKWW